MDKSTLLKELDSITAQLIEEKYKPEHDWTADRGL